MLKAWAWWVAVVAAAPVREAVVVVPGRDTVRVAVVSSCAGGELADVVTIMALLLEEFVACKVAEVEREDEL